MTRVRMREGTRKGGEGRKGKERREKIGKK